MERQLGATHVDIDTIAGWVRFALPEATTLDFGHIADVLDSANYDLHTMEVVLEGEIERSAAGSALVVAHTGQRFALDPQPSAPAASPPAGRVRVTVLEWQEPVPRLRLAGGG